jgi:hypothetical protein
MHPTLFKPLSVFAAMRHFPEQPIFRAMLPKMPNSSKYW